MRALRDGICLLLALGLICACEAVIDPTTGQTETRLTVPFTAANAQRAEEQWQQCVQFRSESFCERRLPGGRPPGAGEPGSGGDYPLRPSDP